MISIQKQKEAIEEMNNSDKGHWSVNLFYFVALVSIFRGVIDLFRLDFVSMFVSLIIVVSCIFVGSTIQTKGTYKKYKEDSLRDNRDSK